MCRIDPERCRIVRLPPQRRRREVKEMKVVEIILTVLEALASVALIVVVLLQSGKEAGLGAIAGNTDSYLGKNKKGGLDQILASATKWVALAWLVLTLSLSFF